MHQRIVRGTVILYSALLLGPVAPWVAGEGDAWVLLAVGCGVGAVIGGLATAERELIAPGATWRLGIAGLVVPLGWFVPIARNSSVESVLLSPWTVGASASVAWLLVIMAVGGHRNAKRREQARTIVEFSARPPESQRRRLAIALAFIMFSGFAVVAVFAVVGEEFSMLTLIPSVTVPVFFAIINDEREVAVTDRGLIIGNMIHRWEKFEGYECDDDVLSVVGSASVGTQRFEIDDIENVGVVRSALGDYLPRLDS
jgi:hypothetical protein